MTQSSVYVNTAKTSRFLAASWLWRQKPTEVSPTSYCDLGRGDTPVLQRHIREVEVITDPSWGARKSTGGSAHERQQALSTWQALSVATVCFY